MVLFQIVKELILLRSGLSWSGVGVTWSGFNLRPVSGASGYIH